VIAKDSGSLYQRGFEERYAAIDVVDATHLRFHLHRPIAGLLNDLDFGIMSAATGLGAGPYTLRELGPDAVWLDANARYFGPHPKMPHVEILFVRDAAARTLMLVGGSADLVQNSMRPDLVDDVIARPRVKVESAPSSLLTYLMMNNDDPALHDVRVRQAIALAIDRPAIIAAQFQGRAVLATGWLPPTYYAYNPDVVHWQRDLRRARRLLAEAGQPHLHLVYKTSSDAFRIAVARVIAAQLAEAGIEVEVRPFEFATFFADIKRGSYQLASMTSGEVEPDSFYMHFHSSRIPDDGNRDAGNRWRYHNAEIDRLTLDVRKELDPVKRKEIYGRVQQILADEVPVIPLWHEDNVVLSSRDLVGYAITPNARFAGLVSAVKQRH
jgi:peptide/nickel transport system substrate-binding protein